MKSKVSIDGIQYTLDIDRAKELGILAKVHFLRPGDVFVHPTGRVNSLLLVKAIWEKKDEETEPLFSLLGLGCSCNNNESYKALHTKDEIRQILDEKGMVYATNINGEIETRVRNVSR